MILRRPLLLALIGVAAVVAAGLLDRPWEGSNSGEASEQIAVALAAVSFVVIAAAARPSWTLSVGLALSVFNTHWTKLGVTFSVDRVLLAVGVVSVLVREFRDGGWPRLRTQPVHWVLAAAVIYATTSALVDGALADKTARFSLIDRFGVIPFAVFFVAPFAFREERDRRVLLGALVALGAYLGVTALLETTGPSALVLPSYITDPSIGTHIDRARGPFTEASVNGLVLFACLIASVIASTLWQSRRWRYAALTVAGLCALGVLFTVTRAAWLAAGAGALIALLSVRETRRYLIPACIVGLLMVVGAFATIPGLLDQAQSRKNSESPLWDRRNSAAAAVRMFHERPLLGQGWGTFRYTAVGFYVQDPDFPLTFIPDVHNLFLLVAVELGLVGCLLWALALLLGVGGAIFARGPPELRPWKIGLLALFVAWLILANATPMSAPMPTLLLWAWAGVARGGRQFAASSPGPAASRPDVLAVTPAKGVL
jgi:O-antigen ligase